MASVDRDTLVALYHATDGASWKRSENWNTDDDISTWDGVEVNTEGRVVGLSLPGNHLRGNFCPAMILSVVSRLLVLSIIWMTAVASAGFGHARATWSRRLRGRLV